MDAGPGLVLLAGTMAFGNEWYQTGEPNWRVPIATLLGTFVVGGLSALNPNAATAFGGIILVGAASAKFGGKSVVQELNAALGTANGKVTAARATRNSKPATGKAV